MTGDAPGSRRQREGKSGSILVAVQAALQCTEVHLLPRGLVGTAEGLQGQPAGPQAGTGTDSKRPYFYFQVAVFWGLGLSSQSVK